MTYNFQRPFRLLGKISKFCDTHNHILSALVMLNFMVLLEITSDTLINDSETLTSFFTHLNVKFRKYAK